MTIIRGPVGSVGQDAPIAGLFGLGALVAGGFSIVAVFAASTLVGIVLIVLVATFLLLAVHVGGSEKTPVAAIVLFVFAAVWSVFAGFIVFKWHWLAFTPAAWVMNALFVGALLAGGWRTMKGWAKVLSALMVSSLVAATILLPRPAGGHGALDTAERWKINVAVVDEADSTPLEGARVVCGTVMRWRSTLDLADIGARLTDGEGRATWEFDEDPRLKIAICTVWKDATETSAGFPAQTQVVPAPAGGGEYELTFALREDSHPDTAFLRLDLSGQYQQGWYYLDFELWRGEPLGEFGARGGPQPLLRRSWHEMPGQGFAIDAAEAQGDLNIRYRYEGPSGPDSGIQYEVRTMNVGAIPGGTRKRIALTIPTP